MSLSPAPIMEDLLETPENRIQVRNPDEVIHEHYIQKYGCPPSPQVVHTYLKQKVICPGSKDTKTCKDKNHYFTVCRITNFLHEHIHDLKDLRIITNKYFESEYSEYSVISKIFYNGSNRFPTEKLVPGSLKMKFLQINKGQFQTFKKGHKQYEVKIDPSVVKYDKAGRQVNYYKYTVDPVKPF